ncbi:hypothetical protein H5410_059471 [Solanum commersonii]|uniref:Uncharacterized protein n=1 Tax=Solanum commersonii TaxID=4109 RepID=A0A9J5W2R5_SOLCO|nr:hypothetical protein H5410_059471 [Solanum commersonii]
MKSDGSCLSIYGSSGTPFDDAMICREIDVCVMVPLDSINSRRTGFGLLIVREGSSIHWIKELLNAGSFLIARLWCTIMVLEEYLVSHLSPRASRKSRIMAKTPEKEEERKGNAPLMNLPVLEEETEGKKMESEIPERAFLSDFPKKSRTRRIKKAGICTKLAKLESGLEKNHSASLEKHIINLDDNNDEEEEEEELETQIDKKIDSSHWKVALM